MEFWTQSPEETEALGAALASSLRPGQVVASPRAPWAQGKPPSPGDWPGDWASHGPVTSPTYTIVNEYTGGRMPLFHFDMYRLSSEEDLFDIGWEDYLTRVACAWWSGAKRVSGALGSPVTVTIEKIPGSDQQRKITIEGGTPWES